MNSWWRFENKYLIILIKAFHSLFFIYFFIFKEVYRIELIEDGALIKNDTSDFPP